MVQAVYRAKVVDVHDADCLCSKDGAHISGTDCIGYRCVKHRVCPAWMVHRCTDQTVQGFKIKDLYGLNWYIE